ncbi:hypothetical protein [Microbacterium sp. GXF6406]
MSDSDFSELDRLVASIEKATSNVMPFVEKAVEKSANDVKKEWTAEAKAKSGTRLKNYPRSIDYEVERTKRREVTAVVGPNPAKPQGRFAAAEEASGGWRRLGARPQNASLKAARKAEKDLQRGVQIAVNDALREADL